MKTILTFLLSITLCANVFGATPKSSQNPLKTAFHWDMLSSATIKTEFTTFHKNLMAAAILIDKKSIQRNAPVFWDAAVLKTIFIKIMTNPLPFFLAISALFLGSRLVRFSRDYYFTFRRNMFKKENSGIGHTKV